MSVRRGGIRNIYSGLLVLAVLLHALIPDGFMPDMRHAGMGHMMMCPAMAGMHPGESGKTQSHHLPCPFAPLATPDLPEIAAALQAVPVFPLTPAFNVRVLASQAIAKSWNSRGPPHLLTLV